MRPTWKNKWHVLSITFLLVVCLLPRRSNAQRTFRIIPEVTPFCVQWQHGEPGHDPFWRGGDPGGNEDKNGSGGYGQQDGPPGTDGAGSDQVTRQGSNRDLIDILGSCYREIVLRIRALL